MDNSWAGPTPPPGRFLYPPRPVRVRKKPAKPIIPKPLTPPLSSPSLSSRQRRASPGRGNSAVAATETGEAGASGRIGKGEEEEGILSVRDGGPGRRRRGAGGEGRGRAAGGGGGQRRRARRGGGARAQAAPPRARGPPVHLHPRQAHQGARPPRVVAGAELRPAAEVQAVRRALRCAGRGARDRQPARRQRQDRPTGHHQHRASRAPRRRRAPAQRQVRWRRPPPPELLIHHHCPPGEH